MKFFQFCHRLTESLLCGFMVPCQSLGIIRLNACSVVIALPKKILCVCISLFSGFTIPRKRGVIALRYAMTMKITIPKTALRIRPALFRRLTETGYRQRHIL